MTFRLLLRRTWPLHLCARLRFPECAMRLQNRTYPACAGAPALPVGGKGVDRGGSVIVAKTPQTVVFQARLASGRQISAELEAESTAHQAQAFLYDVVRGDGFIELDFGEAVSTVKMRLAFPGEPHQRNDFEIYELEVPRCAAAAGTAARRKPKPAEDRRMMPPSDGDAMPSISSEMEQATTQPWLWSVWLPDSSERPETVKRAASRSAP